MCELSSKLSDIKTGYKVLAYKAETNQFFSSFTGEEYKVGVVPKPPKYCKRLCSSWNLQLDYKPFDETAFYNEEYSGKSGAFVHKSAAEAVYDELKAVSFIGIKLVIVRITFSGDVFEGYYEDFDVIAGSFVESFEIINN